MTDAHTPASTRTPGPTHDAAGVEAMFDAIAPRYDLLNAVLSAGMDRRWRAQAVDAAVAKRPARLLDVATGTGDLALALGRALPDAEVRGVDVSEAMLARGRDKVRRSGRDIALTRADGTDLPFEEAAFDVVTIGYGLRNFQDLDAGLREFRRVLRPGGRLVVLEFPPPPRGWFGAAFRAYFTRVLPAIGRLVSGHDDAYSYLPQSVMAFPAPSDLAAGIVAAGFDAVTWTPQTLGVSALHVADVDVQDDAPRTGSLREDAA